MSLSKPFALLKPVEPTKYAPLQSPYGDSQQSIPSRHLLRHSGTYNRRRLFQVERNAELLVEIFQHYRTEGHYKLHAFVVMPDHIHLLLTPRETLERAVGLIKGGFSRRLASKLPVWQRGFTDHRIRDAADYSIRHRYIHQNPVTARLCETPEAYLFSSANTALQLDSYSAVEENGTVPQGLKPQNHEAMMARLKPCP